MTNFLVSLVGALIVFLLLYFVVETKIVPDKKMHQRILNLQGANIGQGRADRGSELSKIPFAERMVYPFFKSIEKKLLAFAPAEIYGEVEHRITLAGKQGQWSVGAFAAAWVLSVVAGFFFAFFVISDGSMPFIQRAAVMMLGMVMGGLFPFAIINNIIRKRQAAILKQLPEVLDLLSVSVQAGLSFDGAVTKIVGRMKGDLIDECRRMQDDVRMGMTRRQSLINMSGRCDVPEVTLFTTAVIQSERLGTSMAKTLVNQADNMRERRRQAAKAEALKAPVKIVFPLVLFIFPALFMVVLLPTLLTLKDAF